MRKIPSAIILLIIVAFMVGCGTLEAPVETQAEIPVKNSLYIEGLSSEDTVKITVSTLPILFDDVELTDSNDIESIVQYLKGLSLSKGPTYESSAGMVYQIEMLNRNNEVTIIALGGNRWIRIEDSPVYTIPYDEAKVFGTIIGNILLNRYRAEFEGTIVSGEVISVSSRESGGTSGCEVKTESGKIFVVDMSKRVSIIDINGGRLILLAGDIVEIGVDSDLVADKVFIIEAVSR